MRTRKAYALIEALIILLCVPMVLSLGVSMFLVMMKYDYALISRQNLIGLIQLRRRLMLGSNIDVSDHRLSMTYQNETQEFICDQDEVYEINGYVSYLSDLEDCRFIQKGGLIYVQLRYEGQKTLVFIAYDA